MERGGRARGREGAEGGEKVGKGEGGLDLDICTGAPRVPSCATGAKNI